MRPSETTRRGLLAACATTAVAAAGCTNRPSGVLASPLEVTTDWPRVEYDARATARAADVTGPETEPSVRWEADVEEMDEGMPAVVVADGTVFVASGSVAAALDAADGSERWRTRVSPSRSPGGGPGKPCSATVGDEHLFVGNFDGLFALDREGAVRWSHEVADPASGASGVFRSPAVVDGSVYFTAVGEGAVYAYTTDGERRWRRDLEGDAAPAGPAVADGTVFAGSETGVHALSADGTRRWTAPLGPVETTPTVDDGTVYVTGEDESDTGSFLAAVDADTGDVGWFNSRQNTVTGSPALRDNGTLGAPTWHGTFFTYDADEGQTLWGTPVGDVKPVVPATDNDRFYVPGRDALYAVSRGRDERGVEWTVGIDGVAGGVAITDAALFVASGYSTGDATRCYALA